MSLKRKLQKQNRKTGLRGSRTEQGRGRQGAWPRRGQQQPGARGPSAGCRAAPSPWEAGKPVQGHAGILSALLFFLPPKLFRNKKKERKLFFSFSLCFFFR